MVMRGEHAPAPHIVSKVFQDCVPAGQSANSNNFESNTLHRFFFIKLLW
jgi:hypothetical protein